MTRKATQPPKKGRKKAAETKGKGKADRVLNEKVREKIDDESNPRLFGKGFLQKGNPSNDLQSLILLEKSSTRPNPNDSFHPEACLALTVVGYLATYLVYHWTKDSTLLFGLGTATTFSCMAYFFCCGLLLQLH